MRLSRIGWRGGGKKMGTTRVLYNIFSIIQDEIANSHVTLTPGAVIPYQTSRLSYSDSLKEGKLSATEQVTAAVSATITS